MENPQVLLLVWWVQPPTLPSLYLSPSESFRAWGSSHKHWIATLHLQLQLPQKTRYDH